MDFFFFLFIEINKAVIWQIVMFFLCVIAFELAVEFVKATLYPADKGKECPRWLGMLLGALITTVYIVMAYIANATFGDAGWYIPGGFVFLPVWAILFYFYQYKALRVAKWFRDRMFPNLKRPQDKPHRKRTALKNLTDDQLSKLASIVESGELDG